MRVGPWRRSLSASSPEAVWLPRCSPGRPVRRPVAERPRVGLAFPASRDRWRASAVTGPDGKPVPAYLQGGTVWPRERLAPGERLTVDVSFRRPSWIGWLVGRDVEHRLLRRHAGRADPLDDAAAEARCGRGRPLRRSRSAASRSGAGRTGSGRPAPSSRSASRRRGRRAPGRSPWPPPPAPGRGSRSRRSSRGSSRGRGRGRRRARRRYESRAARGADPDLLPARRGRARLAAAAARARGARPVGAARPQHAGLPARRASASLVPTCA